MGHIARSQYRLGYVDAAYCYRPSSMVCLSVCRSVGLSVTVVSTAKTAEPIEIPYGLWAHVGSRNIVLDGVQITMRKGNFKGAEGRPVVSTATLCCQLCKTGEPIEMPFECGLGWAQRSMY